MDFFVPQDSIVRRIWGRSDTVMLIFGGAAAEFALNKAVDWLYFTGRLPADPIGRLFSTVSYAQRIIFSSREEAHRAIDSINAIHGGLEKSRNMRIPDWAYRDVLYLLIHYSRTSFEAMERKMTAKEMEDLFDVFQRVGERMNISDLPQSHAEWVVSRERHLRENLAYSSFTQDLFVQYRKHLGSARYRLLLEAQKLVAPPHVRQLLKLESASMLSGPLLIYRLLRRLKVDGLLTIAAVPPKYRGQAASLTPK